MLRGQSRVERGEPLAGRQIDEVVAVGVQTVEEERGERPGVRLDCLRAEATHRHLERMRAAVGAKRDHLAVEHDRRDVEFTDGGDDLRHAIRDVREVAREDRDVVAGPVSLDPRSVELPLDVGGREPLETGRDVACRLREHRAERAQWRQPEPRQPVAPFAHRDLRDGRKIAGEHGSAAHVCQRHAGRLRDCVRHHALERSLPQLAQEQAGEQALLGLRGARVERGELLAARRLRALSCDGLQARHGRVHLEHLERRLVGGCGQVAQRRPPHAHGSLRQLARQVGDRDRHLLGRGGSEALDDALDLRESRRGRRDVSRRRRDQLEQHRRNSTRSGTRATRRRRHPLCWSACAVPPWARDSDESPQRFASAASSSLESDQEAAAAAAFARTCSGFVAPAMIDPTPGVEASAQIASSCNECPRSSANAVHASTRSKRSSAISRPASRVPSGAGSPRRYFPVRSPLASGKYGMYAIAELAAERQHRVVVPALEEAVLVLQDREASRAELTRDPIGFLELLGREIGAADRAHLARADELVERAEGLRDLGCRIGLVEVVEVDVLRLQALERSVDGAADVLGRPVARLPPPAELGGEDDPVAPPAQHLAEKALAVTAVPVDLGRIEERHAHVERGIDDPARSLEIDAPAEVVAAETDSRCTKAAVSELNELHGRNASYTSRSSRGGSTPSSSSRRCLSSSPPPYPPSPSAATTR